MQLFTDVSWNINNSKHLTWRWWWSLRQHALFSGQIDYLIRYAALLTHIFFLYRKPIRRYTQIGLTSPSAFSSLSCHGCHASTYGSSAPSTSYISRGTTEATSWCPLWTDSKRWEGYCVLFVFLLQRILQKDKNYKYGWYGNIVFISILNWLWDGRNKNLGANQAIYKTLKFELSS